MTSVRVTRVLAITVTRPRMLREIGGCLALGVVGGIRLIVIAGDWASMVSRGCNGGCMIEVHMVNIRGRRNIVHNV